MKTTAPYTTKLRIVPQTHFDEFSQDVIECYLVQRWYGFSWPFGFWITNTDIGQHATEIQAIEACIEYYGERPVVDDFEFAFVDE